MVSRRLFTCLIAGAIASRFIQQLRKLSDLVPECLPYDFNLPVLKKIAKGNISTEITMPHRFEEATIPFPNASTLALFATKLRSGFRNEAMLFTSFVLYATEQNFTQILLPSIRWKDLFGTNLPVPHEHLFDVAHWNSFYPTLPRLVSYDPVLHYEFNADTRSWNIQNPELNATHPCAFGRFLSLMNRYRRYTRLLQNNPALPRSPVDLLMLRGAFRPHPGLQLHINNIQEALGPSEKDSSYMALHARVEPDMQKHPVCRNRKVIHLNKIFGLLQKEFPVPPASKLFVAVNRPMLENEVSDPKNQNQIALENLEALNHAASQGLWDGRVKVFEAGLPSLRNTTYNRYSGIAGAMTDFFLAVDADIFVGTEVSTFSIDVIQTRFYRGSMANYIYVPEGLQLATTAEMAQPPRFAC